ncbi:hypothetical protein FBHYGVHD_CDS0005 [Staphylococcus phage MVC_VPHSA1]|uniref:Uncharacterized protein n=1 Tax=Staphylococcus phage MVC_VPHSA1 TaxID=3088876 RepID=A0ABZ0QYI4_9CAUD|nr:hypothetical protein FBHYGVHD_CDS0005 [Staphylococcus phage MVC_VPHSA1]
MELTAEQLKHMRNVMRDPVGFTETTGTVKENPFALTTEVTCMMSTETSTLVLS